MDNGERYPFLPSNLVLGEASFRLYQLFTLAYIARS
jgi:hypothetical protein